MPKEKQSFLERLTGSIKPEPEESESVEMEVAVAKKDFIEERPREKVIVKEIPTMKKERTWMEEAEGQLTIDVYQTPSEIIIKSTIAGVKPEDLDVAITNDMVTVKGRRMKDEEVSQDDYYYQECYWGSFSRSVILPVEVEAEKSKATLRNGILTVRLPKLERIKTKKIQVQEEE
ncbi:MAG: Protein containing Heat shock protein Hsp20 protein [Candidatus Azambacteria bacterium GW2011_GWB2_46_37]|uniref:Protein containing Heat shock protein Hsp20 protein n=6 Tax=Candidatus Azamiibacteriota TaxID=1752741 RepID=A0A0G1Q5E8_9BACT|nr:MAG: Small heat shock protein [Candidatus Azambacteria bacterium GW2011_GWC1_46_13]KKU35393.1 MAG: Protein containing Heat shock protein Hsp20 protein [Candidatus Azambacteria bacterium GW2011_GWB1_46_27]KKU38170.1 MAG: Protein containing Heat shock protein Hsp20 protein [Candidatus Azambacteria bacterium GW2011_GWF2_46_32]KKU38827.1 MAG: Protein containing Heat shock protein Hsp20 protein [Candidatus Azambacteria bacterium GW2011_GWB2_46_37]KKU40149.1 MAG: Protein containing Heat shock prot